MTPNPLQTLCNVSNNVSSALKECSLSEGESSTTAASHNYYVVCKDLFNCLVQINSQFKFISTLKEITDALRNYIYSKRLFDRKCPIIIRCKEDELSKVFGVSEFTIMDVNRLLRKLVFPVDFKDSSEVSCCSNSNNDRGEKRKLVEVAEEAEKLLIEAKKSCVSSDILDTTHCKHTFSQQLISLSPMILHIPPSPSRCESDAAESVHSYQGYETAIVKDTSDDDDSWFCESDNDINFHGGSVVAIEETYDIEYEIASGSGTDIESVDSDSEIEEVIRVMSQGNGQDVRSTVIKVVCKTDSDQEFWADDSSDDLRNCASDAEISNEDKWKCSFCNFLNNPPMRCCRKCWRTRSGWLADKKDPPKRKKPRCRKKYTRSSAPLIIKKEDPSSFFSDPNLPSTSQEEILNSQSSLSSSQEACANVSKLCLLCCSNPADSSIIHGKYAHIVACYRCARKLQHNKKPCPICRRKIERVVYNIC